MLKFGLACEGVTDQAVIENILCGFYNDKELRQEIKSFKLINFKVAYDCADIVVFLVNHSEFADLNYRKDVKVLDFCGTLKNRII